MLQTGLVLSLWPLGLARAQEHGVGWVHSPNPVRASSSQLSRDGHVHIFFPAGQASALQTATRAGMDQHKDCNGHRTHAACSRQRRGFMRLLGARPLTGQAAGNWAPGLVALGIMEVHTFHFILDEVGDSRGSQPCQGFLFLLLFHYLIFLLER